MLLQNDHWVSTRMGHPKIHPVVVDHHLPGLLNQQPLGCPPVVIRRACPELLVPSLTHEPVLTATYCGISRGGSAVMNSVGTESKDHYAGVDDASYYSWCIKNATHFGMPSSGQLDFLHCRESPLGHSIGSYLLKDKNPPRVSRRSSLQDPKSNSLGMALHWGL